MKGRLIIALAIVFAIVIAGSAYAAFPYARPGADTSDYTDLYTDAGQVPNDIGGDSNEFKYSASADPGTLNNVLPTELGGVRGGHLVDADATKPTAWRKTTGRPDVTIATLDSGIEWSNQGAMNNVRFKTRLTRAELPVPQHDRASADALLPGVDCGTYADAYDANDDAVFNIADYACDSRVNVTDARRDGPGGYFTPQDVLIAFSDGTDADGNGFKDDIVGWDFLDNDNDPFDDVSYGHGTGEAEGSSSEADNGGAVGSCPNCMVIHMRVGDSFVADVNRFAAATIYATDNDVQVVQEALGALNNSSLARDAVTYAFRHGVTVIASAADEAAQHNHWPANYPHVIMVNSVTRDVPPAPAQSYTAFNGCTNFYSKLTLAIPSTSCSSDAVGVGSGMAGLIYSAAYSAYEKGALDESERCQLVGDGPDAGSDGPDPCVISAIEVRQLMAAGRIDGQTVVDDIDFAGARRPDRGRALVLATRRCRAAPTRTASTTTQAIANRPKLIPNSFSYPARTGHDQFYGYGRVNLNRGVSALLDNPANPSDALIPPEVELTAPEWYEQIDPARSTFEVRGEVFARGKPYSCRILVAPGHYPNQAEAPAGDFHALPSSVCDGSTRTEPIDGVIADVSTATLKSYFPLDATTSDFTGRETGASGVQTSSGRPNTDPYGFHVKVVATTTQAGHSLTGEDYRTPFLHRDQDMLDDFPKAIRGQGQVSSAPATPTGDGESSPVFADLDGDNRNELLFGSTDGFVHALEADGTELPGWPVRGDRPGFVADHTEGAHAYGPGGISDDLGGAMLASIAVDDVDDDGIPEVFAADLEGKLYGWDAGRRPDLRAGVRPRVRRRAACRRALRREPGGRVQPHPARLHRLSGARRHRRRRRRQARDRRRGDGPPPLRLERRRLRGRRLPGAAGRRRQGRLDRPRNPPGHVQRRLRLRAAGRDHRHARRRRPRRRPGLERSRRAARDRRRHQRGVPRRAGRRLQRRRRQLLLDRGPDPGPGGDRAFEEECGAPCGASIFRCRPATPVSTRSTPAATPTPTRCPAPRSGPGGRPSSGSSTWACCRSWGRGLPAPR